MESPQFKLNVARDEDRISALTDDLLLAILERLELRDAVRAGAVSTRWRHLPHRLSRLELDARHFPGATLVDTMDAFTTALLFVCPPAERNCDCQRSRAIKTLDLNFFLSAPHMSSIGSAFQDVVSRGKTRGLTLQISPPPAQYTAPQLAEFGQQFMSFSRAYQVAFRWLTRLCLKDLAFGDSDVTDLISACDGLERLTLISCWMVEYSVLKIDTPCSRLQELKFIGFGRTIELVSVPKLRQVTCLCWHSENPPVRFGYVPELRDVAFTCQAKVWQAPFLLSECLSRSVTNLWKLHLYFAGQMIWIQPEYPKQLTAIFRNLTGVSLFGIFPECDLSWTLFILEAAPALQILSLSRDRHSCGQTIEDSAEKTNVVWEPSKDLKHLNLKGLQMSGFEEEDKQVTNYIRLVMERAVGLKMIILHSKFPCKDCNDIELEKGSQMNEASRCRVKERLGHGPSSSVEIIMC